jgi:signal transduction histidine kinase
MRLGELIETTVEASQVPASQQDVALSADLPGTALWVTGNRRRLRQVLENLISNAIKYNRPDGWVKVSARHEGNHIITRVSDSGIGIAHDEQSRIFERLYRVQAPETEHIQGTGLGLAIVKSVIERHQGRIWVESVPGQGSIFTFVLPASAESDGAAITTDT